MSEMIKKFIKRWPVTFYNFIFTSIITCISVIILPYNAFIFTVYIFSMLLAALLDVDMHIEEAKHNRAVAIKNILNLEELPLKTDPTYPESNLKG